MTQNSSESRIVETFRQAGSSPGQPQWLVPLRSAAIATFTELGFPTVRDEDWRFTNVAPIAGLPFQPASAAAANGAESRLLAEATFAQLPGTRLVFVNGFFAPKLSRIEKIPNGARVENLSAALAKDSTLIEKHFGKYARTTDNAFAAVNQAFFADGAFISIPANVEIAEPIQLVYICSATQNGETSQPRNLIIAGTNSRATIVESYLSTGKAASLTNAVTEIVAGDNAFIEHVKLQDETGAAFHMAT